MLHAVHCTMHVLWLIAMRKKGNLYSKLDEAIKRPPNAETCLLLSDFSDQEGADCHYYGLTGWIANGNGSRPLLHQNKHCWINEKKALEFKWW